MITYDKFNSLFPTNLWSDPFFIGFNDLWPRLEGVKTINAGTFPPYNIKQISEDTHVIEMALAGFSKNDIVITEENGNLKIEGGQENTDETYVHQGIAKRKFTRVFALAEYCKVVSADMQDGILSIKIVKEIPEEKKPKVITINSRKALK